MSTFNQAIRTQESRTENGMKALAATGTSAVDLFFKIGASRGKNIIPDFVAAFAEDTDLAVRIAQWARDVRGGAGERQLFRDILAYLEKSQPATAMRLQAKVAEIGRWDDLLIDYTNQSVQRNAFTLIKNALAEGNGLCAKWMPRKGMKAVQLRSFLGWSPKRYRKTLVSLTNVVETKMCDQKWDEINFSHVPSLASTRYKGAFYKNAEAQFTEYVDKLTAGDKSVKVNASTAVYPYDILKGVDVDWNGNVRGMSATEQAHVIAQWEALENFMGDANVFPMIDVSGSMTYPAGGSGSVTCMDVAVSLGLYCADKNTGKFKDSFLTFSESPQIVNLRGNIVQKLSQVRRSDWGMNTDLIKAFREMLKMAKNGGVPQEEMPEMLLIMSDMQFDSCARFDDSALQSIRRQYEEAGYSMPQIVFWNIRACDNAPARYDARGVALVSGFSPAVMGSVLGADPDQFTPEAMMRKAVCIERYDW